MRFAIAKTRQNETSSKRIVVRLFRLIEAQTEKVGVWCKVEGRGGKFRFSPS